MCITSVLHKISSVRVCDRLTLEALEYEEWPVRKIAYVTA